MRTVLTDGAGGGGHAASHRPTPAAQAAKVTKENVPGITNFARLETTIACAGAVKAEAVPEIKKMGFASIINVREASEPGAEVEKEEAAAKAVWSEVRARAVQRRRTRSRPGRQVPRGRHRSRQPAGVRALRGGRTRRKPLVHQAGQGRSSGIRSARSKKPMLSA